MNRASKPRPAQRLRELEAKTEVTEEESAEISALCQCKEEIDKWEKEKMECQKKHAESAPECLRAYYRKRMHRTIYYDRQGHPISEWQALGMFDEERSIGDITIGRYRVSTVYLVIAHGFVGEKPIIYETTVFDQSPDRDDGMDLYVDRYCTEEEAILGHKKVCTFIAERLCDGTKSFLEETTEPETSL